jgi:predicted membrane protein
MFLDLCAPAFIYLIFSLIQICVDSFNGLLKTAMIKLFVMVIVTFLLNTLCGAGLSIISWIIVLVPFLFMVVSVSILIYVFGTNISKPKEIETKPKSKTCRVEEARDWEVYRGNVVLLPTYSIKTVC